MNKKKITAFILTTALLVNITGIIPSAGMKSESYSEKQIFSFFKSVGMTDAGASGMMGNMYAESGLKSHNLQNSYEISLGMTDMEYTKKVDAGVYKKFKKDAAGYGLCQWTYHTRKAKLLKYAKSKRKSISDTKMQLQFLIKELKRDYSEVWKTLTTSGRSVIRYEGIHFRYSISAGWQLTMKSRCIIFACSSGKSTGFLLWNLSGSRR